MLPFEDRYSRQRRLVEVGPEGQRRLGASRVRLAPHADVELERQYLERAGVSRIDLDPEAPPVDFPWHAEFSFAAAENVARGAFSALRRIRAALASETE
jgi:hypothetical protein